MSRILQERSSNEVSLEKTLIPKGTVMRLYNSKEGKIFLGKYGFDYPLMRLREGDGLWMSDSQLEVESLLTPIAMARGDVLVGGLGIGLLPVFIRNKRSVSKIDIVEINQDIIDTVFDQIFNRKMRVIHDDIFHYLETTSERYDFIHIDIWPDILAPIRETERVRRAASRCLKPRGRTWVWLEELCERVRNKLPKVPIENQGLNVHEPCLICGKTVRYDFAGLCMDCADLMGISDLYIKRE